MIEHICSVQDCVQHVHVRGLCCGHYQKLNKYGSATFALKKYCRCCGDQFDPEGTNRTFCSDRCRFLDKVDKSKGFGPEGNCWRWNGSHDENGYGHFRLRDTVEKAHRASFRLLVEHEPASLFVCHRCDNPGCVNPSHLFLATNAGNMTDRNLKGRLAYGDRNSWLSRGSYLTEERVVEIRKGPRSRTQELMEKWNVSESAIRCAGSGHSWQHLNELAPPWPRSHGHRRTRLGHGR